MAYPVVCHMMQHKACTATRKERSHCSGFGALELSMDASASIQWVHVDSISEDNLPLEGRIVRLDDSARVHYAMPLSRMELNVMRVLFATNVKMVRASNCLRADMSRALKSLFDFLRRCSQRDFDGPILASRLTSCDVCLASTSDVFLCPLCMTAAHQKCASRLGDIVREDIEVAAGSVSHDACRYLCSALLCASCEAWLRKGR